ncbi:MAG: inositol monophosphatase [Candidatus Kapabacteria bacterium]|nr:inositol monophosphatase [Ignavibacteriota bacterium]MCW5885183.1 inositol monophosphatase [Candidatus Kapabacteria bacterium]
MINELLETAILAAKTAGIILKDGFGTNFRIDSKVGKNNLVTEFDYAAEKSIIETITKKYPNHRFLAEESGNSGSTSEDEIIWVIDPLDGTVNFAHSIPIFAVSIAAMQNGELLCGVIYHPMLDEMFYASKGGGAYLNGNKITVSDSEDMHTSLLVTGFPYNVDKNPYDCVGTFVKIVLNGIPIRRLGSAALDLAYVACGRFDGFWEADLYPWDVAAGVLIVQEAAGKVTKYDGNKFEIKDVTILASNGKIHNQIKDVINQ